jgi:hypothetical protein
MKNSENDTRIQFLKLLYKYTDGISTRNCSMWEIGEELHLGRDAIKRICLFLNEEKSILILSGKGKISITQKGISKIEKHDSNRNKKKNQHIQIIKAQKMSNVQIQQATKNSSQTNTHKIKKYNRVMEKVKKSINNIAFEDETQANEFKTKFTEIEKQLNSFKPDELKIKQNLISIRNILETTISSVVSQELIRLISSLI